MKARSRERGMTILTVIILAVIIAGVSGAFFLLALNESNSTERTRYKTRAVYLAEAGAELGANSLRQACATTPAIITSTDPTVGGVALNAPVPGLAATVLIDGYPVQYNVFKRQALGMTNDPTTGLNSNTASFEIMGFAKVGADALKTTDTKTQEATVYKIVETKGTPLFQFLAFYDNDLELNPGPFAHFHGRMHTNGDMYLTDRDTGRGMIIDTNHLQAAGKMFRSYAGTNQVETGANGPVWVRNNGTTPAGNAVEDANPANDAGLVGWNQSLDSNSSGWGATATSNWNGTVKDGSMGAQKFTPPQIQSVQPGGYYEQQAKSGGLEIQTVGGTPTVMQNGTDVTNAINSAQPGTITTSSIYDAREGKSMPVVTVDVGKLMKSGYAPSNGILYATDPGASSTTPSGIQLINGSYINPPSTAGGFTVASNLPVYVKGDYNGYTDPNTGLSAQRQVFKDPPYNTIPTVDSAGNPIFYNQTMNPNTGGLQDTPPCAIIGDAVNLLSNSWDNSKTSTSSPPGATNTTYNFAMVSGNQATKYDPTAPDNGYNGGLQNLPRFHENWSGVNCNISGAFVNLWRSNIATGVYGKGNVYSPPNRHWDYDQSFEALGKTPPGTPFAMSIGRTTYEEGAVRAPTYDLLPKP
jgi:hypothetical protein